MSTSFSYGRNGSDMKDEYFASGAESFPGAVGHALQKQSRAGRGVEQRKDETRVAYVLRGGFRRRSRRTGTCGGISRNAHRSGRGEIARKAKEAAAPERRPGVLRRPRDRCARRR